MSLHFAILGLLTLEPMSGYTLKTRYFDRSIAHFWPADQSQIYRTLQTQERTGEVLSHAVTSDTRPKSRVYTITDSGRAALADWLAQDQPLHAQRDGFLVQLYFARLLSRDQVLAVLTARRAELARRRDYFDRLDLPEPTSEKMRRQLVFGGLTLDFARRHDRMMVDWIEACIAQISALPDSWDSPV
ncbi:MAG: PadR family transcriptional regulator [Qingshengfaniella sp.]